jgi:uncharacterized protein (DUF697 family)
VTSYETQYEYPAGEWEAEQGEQELFQELVTGETGGVLTETQELELASQLLEINSEEELEEFLGKLIGRAAKGIGNLARSGVGKALVGGLKNVAKMALPVVGGAVGSFVAPGIGTAIGSKLGSMAGNLFELELESMDEGEAEFAVAQEIVRLGARAARTAASAPQNAPPRAVARAAIITAARRHAPGLARDARYGRRTPSRPGSRPRPRPAGPYPVPYAAPWAGGRDGWPGDDDRSDDGYAPDGDGNGDSDPSNTETSPSSRPGAGRWVRRGRTIVLHGV